MMTRRGISILSIQETRVSQTPHYYTDDGFLIILSGSSGDGKEWAGTGFIVAPCMTHAVIGFLQYSARLCCLNMRVRGGKMASISAYAPHSGYSFDQRQAFFEQLGDMIENTSVNGLKLVAGDLNARIHQRFPGEEDVLGEFTFGNKDADMVLGSNRELLLEMCAKHKMVVSNTCFDHPVEDQVTFRRPGTPPLQSIISGEFAQLDFFLAQQAKAQDILDVYNIRTEPLASHHFLVAASLGQYAVTAAPARSRMRHDFSSLSQKSTSQWFAASFAGYVAPKRIYWKNST